MEKSGHRPEVKFEDLGKLNYQQAWDLQTERHAAIVARKRENRQRAKDDLPPLRQTHELLFVEHPPVYTLGKSGSLDNLLLNETELEDQGFTFHKINRGGDITYHGPGQLVAYPLLDLEEFFTDVHRYVRYLEEVVIRTCADYGVAAERDPGYTGVWLPADATRPRRKICAIGVHLSRWTTLHGFAFNISPDLNHFNHIIPCGIDESDRGVTRLADEVEGALPMDEVKRRVKEHFRQVFEFDYAATHHTEARPHLTGNP